MLDKPWLFLQDEYDNISGTSLNGKVEVVIKKPSQIDEVPMLLGNAMMTEFALINGTANVQNISIQQNTAGKDGQEYILSFSVRISGQQLDIPPFNLPFLFYNGEPLKHNYRQIFVQFLVVVLCLLLSLTILWFFRRP